MYLSEETKLYGVPPEFSPGASSAFSQVATIPEVCDRWGKSRKAVLMRIYRGHIEAMQYSKTWLVYLPSVVAIWGEAPGERH